MIEMKAFTVFTFGHRPDSADLEQCNTGRDLYGYVYVIV